MTAERIAKLRELADRGVGGEKTNARDILTKLGIDWKKPKESFSDRIKQSFGASIRTKYRVEITNTTGTLFIMKLLSIFCKGNTPGIVLENNWMTFYCTPAEMKDISRVYHKHLDSFESSMWKESSKYINNYLGI